MEMDFSVILKDIRNLNRYIILTQELGTKYSDTKIEFNLATLQCVKNIRSLEIEYFNKCDGTGAALIVVERILLQHPPSKTWGILGLEIVALLKYWLDAVRKHLISHHIHWWTFLKQLLDFIKVLLEKHSCFNNLLLEHLTDGLLDLATRGKLEVNQRYEILHTLNLYCLKCSKRIRYAHRDQYEHYFLRLATLIATCGHVPSQYVIMETLLRWLVERREESARREAALKWLPSHLYRPNAIQLFVTRSWYNFEQDVREFLNTHNETGNLITSVKCKKLSVGDKELVTGSNERHLWLDINISTRCLTILVSPGVLYYTLGVAGVGSCETISITSDTVVSAKLFRESEEVRISLSTAEPPRLVPSAAQAFGEAREIEALLTSPVNVYRVNDALRTVFDGKYEVLLDFEDLPPEDIAVKTKEAGDSRFPRARRSRHIGQIVRSGRVSSMRSPSSVSTSSLAQLCDKLKTLPPIRFDKEPVAVCVTPKLSEVTEVPESDTSTLKVFRHCDVITKRFNLKRDAQSDTEISSKSRKQVDSSDGDDKRSDVTQNFFKSNIFTEFETPKAPKNKNIEAIIDEDSTSCLLVTTIGSADQSVINDTLERLAKDNECRPDNIVDLLVQEALQSKVDDKTDSGINTGESKKIQTLESEVIENSFDFTEKTVRFCQYKESSDAEKNKSKTKTFTVVSKSTSDESNTEAINETPFNYVTVRRMTYQRKRPNDDKVETKNVASPALDPKVVEDFFSQNIAERTEEDTVISPTLAKKINETSSESSEEFDQSFIDNADDIANVEYDFPDVEVVECLNDIVDKVCSDFDKYCEYLALEDKKEMSKDNDTHGEINKAKRKISNPDDNTTALEETTPKNILKKRYEKSKLITQEDKPKLTKSIKLNYKIPKNTTKQSKLKNKLKLENVAKMSPIVESSDKSVRKSTEENIQKTSPNKPRELLPNKKQKNTNDDIETPLKSRRRKLYSPKSDVQSIHETYHRFCSDKNDTSDDDVALIKLKKTSPKTKTEMPKSKTYGYAEIEKARENYKFLRSKRNISKFKSISPQPQNDVFDKLKENIENEEKITVVDKKSIDKDIGVFNFTSDSEDEDFKKKKCDLQKRVSSTTLESGNSVISTKKIRPVRSRARKTIEKDISSDDQVNKTSKRKKPVKRKNSKTKLKDTVLSSRNLEDERMRKDDCPEILNTSFVEKTELDKNCDLQNPQILVPHLELVPNDEMDNQNKELEAGNAEKILETNKDKPENLDDNCVVEERYEDRTISPLPGLLVEKENTCKKANDFDDSLTTATLEQKFKKVLHEGPETVLFNDTNTTHNLLSDLDKTNYSLAANDANLQTVNELNFHDALRDINTSPYKHVEREKTNGSTLVELKPTDNDAGQSPKVNNENTCTNLIDERNTKDIDSSIENISIASSKPKKYRSLQLKNKKCLNKKTGNITPTKNIQNTIEKHVKSPMFENSREIDFIQRNISNVSENSKKCNKIKSFNSEPINISDATEYKSEKSIPTEGITARGEIESAVEQDLNNLDESVIPRELVDMDDSLKEYYIKLRAHVNLLQSSKEDVTSKDPSKSQNHLEKIGIASPVVSVTRMPTEEVLNWINVSNEKSKPLTIIEDDFAKYLPSRRNSDSDLPSPANTTSDKSERSLVVSLNRLSPIEMNKWLSPREGSVETSALRLRSRTKTSTPEKKPHRNTLISPIKLFEEIPKFTRNRLNSNIETASNSTRIISPARRVKQSPVFDVTKRYTLRSTLDTNSSKASKSSKMAPQLGTNATSKRRTLSKCSIETKRRKVDVTLDGELSGMTQSVKDWLRTKSAKSSIANIDQSTRDAVQLMVERLDTTLAEIHQNTTENFIALFVNTQKVLSDLREHKARQHDTVATTVQELQKTLAGLNEEVALLDKRSQEMDQEFMEWFKNQASNFIRCDCKRKQTMVSLLREDIDALFDYGQGQSKQ